MERSRVIGLDFGSKRVGLAVADPLRMFAQPVGTYSPDETLNVLEGIQGEEGIDTIVVGWPQRPDGSEGTAIKNVSAFVSRVTRLLPAIHIVRWNEEYTSETAKELISQGEKPSLKRSGRGRIDAAAAAIILQEYLNHKASD